MNEVIRLAIRDAQQERRKTIPQHGGTPESAERLAATHEAAQARRAARNMENKQARWDAAQQEAGYCRLPFSEMVVGSSHPVLALLHKSRGVLSVSR